MGSIGDNIFDQTERYFYGNKSVDAIILSSLCKEFIRLQKIPVMNERFSQGDFPSLIHNAATVLQNLLNEIDT
ncbi:MAG: hypothetical protein LBD41_04925 [Clostridiales Family XIII bacterium]|jgi:hypothetical protein|nr:hypothetical protein [Clostridiales Family XIII bacterium]